MEWKNHIQSIIHDNEFGQQNDWDIFNKKYRRHKFIKQLRQITLVTSIILSVGAIVFLSFNYFTGNEKIPTTQKTFSTKTDKNTYSGNNQTNTINDKNITKNQSPVRKTTGKIRQPEEKKQPDLSLQTIQDSSVKPVSNQKEANTNPVTYQKLISADFSADKLKGCGTLTVQFTPKIISDSVIYLWEFGDGSFSNEKTPDHLYKNAGTYTVSLTTKHFFCNKLNQKIKKNLIVVNEKPKAAFSYKCFSGKEVQINNLSTNYKQCQWFLDGFSVSNDCSPQLSMEEGSHDISLLLINQECTDSIGKTISIYPEIKMYPPTAFTPDGDGKNDEFKPVFSHLPDSYKILIFDRLGKIVFSSTNPETGWNGKINGQEPKENIYLWKIVYQQKNNTPVEKSGQVKLIIK